MPSCSVTGITFHFKHIWSDSTFPSGARRPCWVEGPSTRKHALRSFCRSFHVDPVNALFLETWSHFENGVKTSPIRSHPESESAHLAYRWYRATPDRDLPASSPPCGRVLQQQLNYSIIFHNYSAFLALDTFLSFLLCAISSSCCLFVLLPALCTWCVFPPVFSGFLQWKQHRL